MDKAITACSHEPLVERNVCREPYPGSCISLPTQDKESLATLTLHLRSDTTLCVAPQSRSTMHQIPHTIPSKRKEFLPGNIRDRRNKGIWEVFRTAGRFSFLSLARIYQFIVFESGTQGSPLGRASCRRSLV
jgi:hypothetical protein